MSKPVRYGLADFVGLRHHAITATLDGSAKNPVGDPSHQDDQSNGQWLLREPPTNRRNSLVSGCLKQGLTGPASAIAVCSGVAHAAALGVN
jgi:isochorismate synthase EntC